MWGVTRFAALLLACATTEARLTNVTSASGTTVDNGVEHECESAMSTIHPMLRTSDGLRQYSYIKVPLDALEHIPGDPTGVTLYLRLSTLPNVRTLAEQQETKPYPMTVVDLSGDAGWDAESLTCYSLPTYNETAKTAQLYFNESEVWPGQWYMTADISEIVAGLIEAKATEMAIALVPTEGEGNVNVKFRGVGEKGTIGPDHDVDLAPFITVESPDFPGDIPVMEYSALSNLTAGETFMGNVQVPFEAMNCSTTDAAYPSSCELPEGSFNISVMAENGTDPIAVNYTFSKQGINFERGYVEYLLKYLYTGVGQVVLKVGFETAEDIENTPMATYFTEGFADPQTCSTEYGRSVEFFENNSYPRVGYLTCFNVSTVDAFGNPVLVAEEEITAEVIAGTESRPSTDLTIKPVKGSAEVCFTPADADMITVSVFIEGSPLKDFPFEVDCIPGDIVPAKTTVKLADKYTAGQEGFLRFTTLDSADHVTNVNLENASVSFVGPGTVTSDMTVLGDPAVPSGLCRVNFTADVAGYYNVKLTSDSFVSGPFTVLVKTASAEVATSELTVDTFVSVVGRKNLITVTSKDESGNPVSGDDLDIVFEIKPQTISYQFAKVVQETVPAGDGSYALSWKANKAAKYDIIVREKAHSDGTYKQVKGSPFMVELFADAMSTKMTTWVKPLVSYMAAGEDPLLKVQEMDQYGNARKSVDADTQYAATITAASTGEVEDVPLHTDGGLIKLDLAPEVVGDYTVEVTVKGAPLCSADIEVAPGPLSPASTVLLVDGPAPHVVGETMSVVIRARDAYGNQLVEGDEATAFSVVALHPGKPAANDVITVSNGDGTYTVTFTPAMVGSYNVYVEFNTLPVGQAVGAYPLDVMVGAGPAVGHTSFAVGDGTLRTAVAGKDEDFVIKTRDVGANDVEVGGVQVYALLARTADKWSPSTAEYDVSVTDNNDGTYSAVYNTKEAGYYRMFVRVQGDDILASPFIVGVEADRISNESEIDASDWSATPVVAGDAGIFKVTAYDQYKNRRLVGGDAVKCFLTYNDSGNVSLASLDDLGNGTYVATAMLSKAGVYNISATNEFGEAFMGVSLLNVTVLPNNASAPHSTVVGPLHNSATGSTTTLTLILRDIYYNELITGGDSVILELSPKDLAHNVTSAGIVTSVQDMGDGKYTLRYTASIAMDYVVKAGLNSTDGIISYVAGFPEVVKFSEGQSSGLTSYLSGSQPFVTAGRAIHYVLHAKDLFNNTRHSGGDVVAVQVSGTDPTTVSIEIQDDDTGLYYVKVVPTRIGQYPLTATINGEVIDASAFVLTVHPAPTAAENTTVDFSSLLSPEEAGVAQSFAISPHDVYGNPTNGSLAIWQIKYQSAYETVLGDVDMDTLIANFTPTRSGVGNITVLCNGKPVDQPEASIEVAGSWTSAARTMVTGAGLSKVTAGGTGMFRILPRDRFSNPSTKGPVNVDIIDREGFPVNIKTTLDGEFYNISYQAILGGLQTVSIQVGDQHVVGSPFTVVVRPNHADASTSKYNGKGLTSAVQGKPNMYSIVTYDYVGNPRLRSVGDTIDCMANATVGETTSQVLITKVDLGIGQFDFSYMPDVTGSQYSMVINCTINGEILRGKVYEVPVYPPDLAPEIILSCPEPNCNGHGSCDNTTGLCSCFSDWTGLDCNTPYQACPNNCSDHGQCDFSTGLCHCLDGWTGDACETDPNGETVFSATEGKEVKPRGVDGPMAAPDCPHQCSTFGVCRRGVEGAPDYCECDPGHVGAGCEITTTYQLITMDKGLLMIYEVATGRLHGYQQNLALDHSCSGLNKFVLKSDVQRPAQRKFVHIGGVELLEVDPLTSMTHLLEFDEVDLGKGLLTIPKVKVLGNLPMFSNKEAVYAGMNKLLLTSFNGTEVYRVNRNDAGDVMVTKRNSHKWKTTVGHVAYMGHDYVAKYTSNGTVDGYFYDRDLDVITEPAEYMDKLEGAYKLRATKLELKMLASDMLFAFDHRLGNYKVYNCPMTESGEMQGCTFLNDGNIVRGYNCSHIPAKVNCSSLHRSECIKSDKCGYCFSSMQCLAGTADGPTEGTCDGTMEGVSWVYSASQFVTEYHYMAKDRVMSFEPSSGKYAIWNIDRSVRNKRYCRNLIDTVASGYLQNTVHHQINFMGNNMLDFSTQTGKFRLALCSQELIELTGKMQCETWAQGRWPLLRGRKIKVIESYGKYYLLEVLLKNGNYRLWGLSSRDEVMSGKPAITDLPIMQGTLGALVNAVITQLDIAGDLIVTQQPMIGTTAFLRFNGLTKSFIEAAPPVKKGVQVVDTDDGGKEVLQVRYASAGKGAMIQYGPQGYWKFMRCSDDPTNMTFDEIGAGAPIHCEEMSSGSPSPPLCGEKTSNDTCTASPLCGWCQTYRKCYNGYRAGVCSTTADTCPEKDWNYVGGDIEAGGFIGKIRANRIAENEIHDCSLSSQCSTCVADSQCGWHMPSKSCVLGGMQGPTDGTAYPITGGLAKDWNFQYCTGVDGCANQEGCDACTKKAYCGFCPAAFPGASTKCMTALNPQAPLFETCASGFTFQSDKCASLTTAQLGVSKTTNDVATAEGYSSAQAFVDSKSGESNSRALLAR